MNDSIVKEQSEIAVDDFWRISTQFYNSPMVSDYLLELQNSQNKNVNELLFALWCSHYYKACLNNNLVGNTFTLAERTKSWAANIRNTRFELEAQWQAPYPEKIRNARDAMLETELKIERIHQQKLVEGFIKSVILYPFEKSDENEAMLLMNIALCCGEARAESDYLQLVMLWQGFLESEAT